MKTIAFEEKKRPLSRQTSLIDFFKSRPGTRTSSPVFLHVGGDGASDSSK
jgi:hypothetical protein